MPLVVWIFFGFGAAANLGLVALALATELRDAVRRHRQEQITAELNARYWTRFEEIKALGGHRVSDRERRAA